MSDLPTKEELSKLTRRACVAYAARCAQRVEPLYCLAVGDRRHVVAVRAAIESAVACAHGEETSAKAAAGISDAARAAKDASAANAARAAQAADNAAATFDTARGRELRDYAVKAASQARTAANIANEVDAEFQRQDFKMLLQLADGDGYGDPIDFEQLGPLWPDGDPDWFTNGSKRLQEILRGEPGRVLDSVDFAAMPDPLQFFIDPGSAPAEDVQEVLEAISDLHVASGGLGLEFKIDGLFVRAREGVVQ